VPTTWATGSLIPSEKSETSPITNVRPVLMSLHSPMMRALAAGFRKKLMFKLVVTANGTMPILPNMATDKATSTLKALNLSQIDLQPVHSQ
jgi:hypothetical protein